MCRTAGKLATVGVNAHHMLTATSAVTTALTVSTGAGVGRRGGRDVFLTLKWPDLSLEGGVSACSHESGLKLISFRLGRTPTHHSHSHCVAVNDCKPSCEPSDS